MDKSAPKYPVNTVYTAFEILELIKDNDGATLTEIAAELGVAKSTAHRHLKTLDDLRYIVYENEMYQISHRFLEFGKYTQERKTEFKLVEEKVKEIARTTNERVQFIVEEHGEAVYVFHEFGDHGVRTDPGIGMSVPLHATAAGKAILAFMDSDKVRNIVEHSDLKSVTENTTTDRTELHAELQEIRERGYSVNDQGWTKGLRAVGAPVRDANDEILGSISVSGPSHRLKGDLFNDELPNYLLGTVNELELNIAHL